MNHIFGRKQFAPREIDDRNIVFDARPPSPEAAVERLHRVIKEMPPPNQPTIECDYGHRCWNPRCLEAGNCVGGLKPESEVMPDERTTAAPADTRQSRHDTRPLGATGAARINPLDDIATLLRSLTYGEMMELAAAIWKIHDDTSTHDELNEKTLPATLHRWSGEHGD